ncbi:hypothetical protein IWQ62_002114 [Dispira parvispora]|uniref:Etoposide-induced protein 2.4-domain-containing protein n=1 Tax=Dispira parvispora TaxID=1520584 RepID=A0A9W8AR24_9FUNG|nr:hypothetical protein IWQ62_002114 [Dispira parvispora]
MSPVAPPPTVNPIRYPRARPVTSSSSSEFERNKTCPTENSDGPTLTWATWAKYQAWFVWAGVKDASTWPTCLIVVYGSRTIQRQVFKCVFLNGVLFLGSIIFYHAVLRNLHLGRLITWWWQDSYSSSAGDPTGHDGGGLYSSGDITPSASMPVWVILEWLVTFAYNAFWLYPLYCLSFLLNAIWYQEIADRVYTMRGGEPTRNPLTYSTMLRNVASEIYRILLFFTYVVWTSLIYLVPVIGPAISFILCCWLYAFYSFEYQWINKNWSFEKRLDYLERRWAYFMGFGLPCTLCTFFSSQFISAGVFAFLFPMYIIMANIARPLPRRFDPTLTQSPLPSFLSARLPIFTLPKRFNTFLLYQFRRYQYRRSRA